ncbi:MAG: flagellar biosynthesis anti-sigma factor FlgM [Fimbriimonadaceae bacterium]
MRISDNEVKKILSQTADAGATPSHGLLVEEIKEIGAEAERRADAELVKQVVEDVIQTPDREDMIADLRARIEAGAYHPSGDDIAEAMIRRSIADRIT